MAKVSAEPGLRMTWCDSRLYHPQLPNKHFSQAQDKPVDISMCTRPGKNSIKMVQLGDLSEYMFLLHASVQEDPLHSTSTSAAWERYEEKFRTMTAVEAGA